MAQKRHLTQYDSSGNKREIYLNDDEVLLEGGQTLRNRLAEMQEEIDDAAEPVVETDPTVPSWAKQPVKPTYTPQEVGAVPSQGYVEYTQAEKEKLGALPTASELDTELGEKANANDVYDKQTVDQKVANAGKVKSVSVNDEDPVQPDQNGNVHLEIEGGEGKSAYQSYLDTTTDNPKKTEAEWVASLKGPKGDTGNVVVSDGVAQIGIINDLETGGEGDALSGAMGKVVAGREATDRERIDEIVAILKKAVFTESVSFDNLDALASATDSIYLDKSSYTFNGIGGTMRLVAHVDPSTATSNIVWSSSNTSVATVTSDGTVVAIADGSAVITARDTISGKTATCSITVQQFVPNSVTISQATINSDGEHWKTTKQLTASTDPAGGTISWSILPLNSPVATVNNGLVTLLANGQCTVRASCGNKYADCAVDVQNLVRTSYSIAKTLDNASVSPNDANVLEGENLDLTITADPSHVLDTVSVMMGNVPQTVTIASDNKSATCAINNVSGDIAISATATFVETNLMDTAETIAGGSVEGTQVVIKTGTDAAKYSCKRVKLEKGKYYKIKNLRSNNNCNGFDALLQKDDGNGGYTPLLPADLVDSSNGLWVKLNNTLFSTSTGGYRKVFGSGNSFTYTDFVFSTPPADELQSGVGDIYLVIDTMYNSDAVDSNFGLYEWRPKTTLDFTDIMPMWRANVNFLFGFSYGCATIIKLEKGATYNFSDYNALATANQNIFSLLRGNGNEFAYLKSTDFKSGSTWLTGQNFFVVGGAGLNNIGKNTVGTSGSFTVPTDNDVDGDLYLTVALSTTTGDTDSVVGSLTITKTQS